MLPGTARLAGSWVESPTTAQNWAIGCIETISGGERPPFPTELRPPSNDPPQGNGLWESFGRKVEPRSLYLKQLEDRLCLGAVEAIKRR